jgi:hypothetical protein
MNKISEQKLIFKAFMVILLICSTYVYLTPFVHAAPATTAQQSLKITSDVLSINASKCDITTKAYPLNAQATYMGVPQETIMYNITSNQNKLSLIYTFANGNLQLIQVLRDDLQNSMKHASIASISQANVFGAKVFLDNYQQYTRNSLYSNLISTLNTIDATKNATITSGNMKLEVICLADGSNNFKWYYTANGASAPYSKFIALGLKDGRLTSFVDNWQFYNVGSTKVNVSKEEAIAIALNTAKAHAYNISLDAYGLQTNNMNNSNIRWTSLIFDSSVGANVRRSNDSLALYPVWRVGVALDKWYGEMYGIEVEVWADTGQVRSIQEAYSPLSPIENASITSENSQTVVLSQVNPNMSLLVTVAVIGLSSGGILGIWIAQKKRLHYMSSLRMPFKKIGGILLCVLLSLSMLLTCIGTASATTRGAVVWGSESDAARNLPPPNGDGLQWRKSQLEINTQQCVASYIATQFANNGYSGNPDANNINHQGEASSQTGIPNDITYLNNNYDYMAVVDFDHGVGGYAGLGGYGAPSNELHYMFEDNSGTITGTREAYDSDPPGHTNWVDGVYDMEIYPLVTAGNVVFAFINTCLSADTNTFGPTGGGMIGPDIWPARAIGMPYAWTHRNVADINEPGFSIVYNMSSDGYNNPDWGYQVYIGFTYGSASLSQPLPWDSGPQYYNWVADFFDKALNYDYSVKQALDSASSEWYGHSFGSSPLQDFIAYWEGFPPQPNCKMAVYGNSNIHLKNFNPPADVPNIRYLNGPTTGNTGVYYQFSAFAGDPYGHNVQYRFDWDDGSPYEETNWCSDGVAAIKSHSWVSGRLYNVRVQARCPNSGWGSWSSPISVLISSPSNYWVSSIYDADGAVYNPENLVGSQPDGQFASVQGWGPYQYYGYIVGAMNEQATGHIYMYGGGNGPLYVYVSSNGYNFDLVSTPYVNSGSPYWIDCGIYEGTFNYIAVTAEDPNYIYGIALDSVKVEPT